MSDANAQIVCSIHGNCNPSECFGLHHPPEKKCYHGFSEARGCKVCELTHSGWTAYNKGEPPGGFESWAEFDSWHDWRMS